MQRIKLIVILLAAAIAVSCGVVAPSPTPTIFVPTNTPQIPTVTPTPDGPVVEFEEPTLWNMYDPKDPTLPELIIPSDDGFRLDPDWNVEKIEYAYDWWGMGEPGLGYEIMEKKASSYYWQNQEVSPKQISAFFSSIKNLHPVQSLLVGIWHTDDYPTWQLELTGTDGNHILLYAASNENIGAAPWHVIYNGRIYAQYDGAIGLAVGGLFPGTESSPARDSSFGNTDPNFVGFATMGWPNQLSFGFTGLLPISGSFNYQADLKNQEIRGYIHGRYSIGGFGNMIVGTLESLRSVKLTINDSQQPCEIGKVESEDAYSAEWTFVCKLSSLESGQRYRYPIRVEFRTDRKTKFIAEGELYGQWSDEEKIMTLPPADEVLTAINVSSGVSALHKDAIMFKSTYTGKYQIDQDTSPTSAGQMIFLGQAKIDGVRIRYTIGVSFVVENRRFSRFGLNDDELKRFLSDVFRTPLAQRILRQDPDVIFNLWYVESGNAPAMPKLLMDDNGKFLENARVRSCRSIPESAYPVYKEPIRSFSFNSPSLFLPSYYSLDEVNFILLDDVVAIKNMKIFGGNGPEIKGNYGDLYKFILPPEFDLKDAQPFMRIEYDITNAVLRFKWPLYFSDADLIAYQNFFESLPASAKHYEKLVTNVNDILFLMGDDGVIRSVACYGK